MLARSPRGSFRTNTQERRGLVRCFPEHEADEGRAEQEAPKAGDALDPGEGRVGRRPQHQQHRMLIPKAAQDSLPEDGPGGGVGEREVLW